MSRCAPIRNERRPHVALTPGEPAGIGPDIAAEVAADIAADGSVRLTLIGDPDLLRERAAAQGRRVPDFARYAGSAGEAPPDVAVLPVPLREAAEPGVLDPRNSPYVLACLDRAVAGCLAGEFDALVTGPVHKGIINDAGIPFTGHTEYLARRCGDATPVMMLVADRLRVALVTTHLPLRAVPDAITTDAVGYVIRTVDTALRERFGVARPRLLVCGLNPHAGEGGHLGAEDDAVIAPAVRRARDLGLDVEGPLPADTAFNPERRTTTDAYVAMYHDQGLPVLKALGFGRAVNVTLGLPIVRTSVDHGTALDLAGSGRADAGSLRSAIRLAGGLASLPRRA